MVRLTVTQARALGFHGGTRQNKYRAVRVGGFDSKREARRYDELCLLVFTNQIYDLRRQPEFHVWIGGKLVTRYVSDFYYQTRDGAVIIEDAKGFRTPTYRLKKKLVEAIFGVEIVES